MTKQIINLTPLILQQELETVLEQCPYYPHQWAFAMPALRQKLLRQVTHRVRHIYLMVDQARKSPPNLAAIAGTLSQRQAMRAMIRDNMQHLLQDYAEPHLLQHNSKHLLNSRA